MESGYIVDGEGSTFIASTQRPDGTWRKQRRVKEGYVPQEEVPLYESKGKIFEKNQPKYPVGLSEEYVREAQMRREAEQKRQGQQSIPGLTPTTAAGKKKKKKKPGSEKVQKASLTEDLLDTPYFDSADTQQAKDEWTVVGKSKGASVPITTPKKEAKAAESGKQSKSVVAKAPKVVAAPPPPIPEGTDPAKRVKNLRKVLRGIELIEEKRSSGAKLEKEQLDKIARKNEVESEINQLMKQFNLS